MWHKKPTFFRFVLHSLAHSLTRKNHRLNATVPVIFGISLNFNALYQLHLWPAGNLQLIIIFYRLWILLCESLSKREKNQCSSSLWQMKSVRSANSTMPTAVRQQLNEIGKMCFNLYFSHKFQCVYFSLVCYFFFWQCAWGTEKMMFSIGYIQTFKGFTELNSMIYTVDASIHLAHAKWTLRQTAGEMNLQREFIRCPFDVLNSVFKWTHTSHRHRRDIGVGSKVAWFFHCYQSQGHRH